MDPKHFQNRIRNRYWVWNKYNTAMNNLLKTLMQTLHNILCVCGNELPEFWSRSNQRLWSKPSLICHVFVAMNYRSFGPGAIYARLWCKPSIISYVFVAMNYQSSGPGAIFERLWSKSSIISYELGNELPEFWSRSGAPWPRSGRCGGSSAGQCPSGPCRHAGYHLQPPIE